MLNGPDVLNGNKNGKHLKGEGEQNGNEYEPPQSDHERGAVGEVKRNHLLGIETKEPVARCAKSAKNNKDAGDGDGNQAREVVARRPHG